MNKRRNEILQIILYLLLELILVGAAFTAGYFSHRVIAFPEGDFPVLKQAYQFLRDYSYNDLPSQRKLEYGMIRGMLDVVKDPYTSFFEPPQAELQSDQLAGKYGGIGCRIQTGTDGLVYLFPFPGSPGAEGGIQDGDQLLSVDDLQISESTSADDLQAKIRGPVGSQVKIIIIRSPGRQQITFTISRREVALPSVTFNLLPEANQIGLIQLNVIADTSPKEVDDAIQALMKKGAKKFILDLRNNGGGLVDAGVNVSRMFLKSGDVLQEQYRGKPVTTYKVEQPGKYATLPLVVLVNNNTASAAEIIAGALQGQHRVLLIGSQTYGKDSVQLVFDLLDKSSLHVTAAHWWIPGLNLPKEGKGLLPDIQMSKEIAGSPEIFKKAITALQAQ
jgi:carboxyl-terminal processing protease